MTTVIEEQVDSEQEIDFSLIGIDNALEFLKQKQPGIITNSGHAKADCKDASVQKVNPKKMSAKFAIVTRQKQANLHNNKVQITRSKLGQGIRLDLHKRAPVVLFEHGELPFPIGISETPSGKHTVILENNVAFGEVFFSQVIKEAAVIFALVDEGTLRMSSIGFLPDRIRRLPETEHRVLQNEEKEDSEVEMIPLGGGFDIVESLLIEWSITASGADIGAFKQALSRGDVKGEKLSALLLPVFQKIAGPSTAWSPGWATNTVGDGKMAPLGSILERHKHRIEGHTEGFEFLQSIGSLNSDELKAGQYSLSFDLKDIEEVETEQSIATKYNQHFDVAREQLEASKLEYEWISRYVGCQVKQLFNLSTYCPELYMGSFLTGLEKQLEAYIEEDVRQMTAQGREIPPTYETVQLNSKLNSDFLIDGLQFLVKKGGSDAPHIVLKIQRYWSGVKIDAFANKEKREEIDQVISGAWEWSEENNFLKNEAFSLRGRFIPQSSERFEDVFLEEENKKPIQFTVNQINKKGVQVRNRGMIFAGPPGTGKTMAGRIIRNTAQATFIWISARDLSSFGAMDGFQYGFDIARELAPSVLFIEDIDNFLYPQAIDCLKTEMDGIGISSGVVTILTSNYPEKLPKAILDRPGRFDDVLKFDLPNDVIRKQMLSAWLGDSVTGKVLLEVVERTEGYSGAHLKELVKYAIVLNEESEEDDFGSAVLQALEKIEKQKDLIDRIQLQNIFVGNKNDIDFHKMKPNLIVVDDPNPIDPEIQKLDVAKFGEKLVAGLDVEEQKQPPILDTKSLVNGITDRVTDHLNTYGDDVVKDISQSVETLIKRRSGILV